MKRNFLPKIQKRPTFTQNIRIPKTMKVQFSLNQPALKVILRHLDLGLQSLPIKANHQTPSGICQSLFWLLAIQQSKMPHCSNLIRVAYFIVQKKYAITKYNLQSNLPFFFALGNSNIKRFPSNHLSVEFIQLNTS